MASGLSIVVDTRSAEQSIKNLHQLLQQLEQQGNSVANMMRGLSNGSFNGIASSANSAKTQAKDLGDALVYTKISLQNASGAAGLFQSALRSISTSLNTAQSALIRFNQSGQSIVSMFGNLNGVSGSNGVNNLNNTIKALNPNVAELNNQVKQATASLKIFTTAANNATSATSRLNTTVSSTHASIATIANTANTAGSALNSLQSHAANLKTQLTGAGANIALLSSSLNTLSVNSNNAGRGINTISTAANNSAGGVRNADNAFSALSGTFSKLQALAAGGVFGVSFLSVLKTADAMQNLDNQVRIVTKSTAERLAVEAQVFNIANKNYMSLQTTTDIYHRNALAMAAMGASQKDVLRFTDNMSLAMRTSGRSITEQNSALYQWSQAMGAGKLQGQEFKIIALAVPSLLKYIAAEMGVSQGALKKLGSEGKISAEVMVKALEKARPELEKLASQMPMTMTQSLSIFKNKYDKFIDEIMNGTGGASRQIAGVLQFVGNNFSALANIAGGVATAALVKFAVSAVTSTVATSGLSVASLSLTSTMALANIRMGLYTLGMNGIMIAARGVMVAQGALAVATMPVGVAFTAATTAIRANLTALTQWSTYSGIAAAAGTRLATGVSVVGGAFIRVASIINAHPLMFLATVIFAVVASTEGLEGAMKSLGDAVGLVGGLLADFTKAGVKGMGSLLASVIDFTASFFDKSKSSTTASSQVFDTFFSGTKGGFVGIVQTCARIFDMAGLTIRSFVQMAINGLMNIGIAGSNVVSSFKAKIGIGDGAQTEYEKVNLYEVMEGKAEDTQKNGFEIIVNAKIAEMEANKKLAQSNVDLTKTMDPQAYAMYKQARAAEAAEKAQKALIKAQKEALNGARLVGISGNTGIGTGAHLHIQTADGNRRLTNEELNRFQANGKSLFSYGLTSEYGARNAPVAGASTFHRGVDFGLPKGTAITSKVPITDIKTYQANAKSGYISLITFADGLQVKLLHQSPNVMGIKGGSSTGISKVDNMLNQAHKAAMKNGGGLSSGEQKQWDTVMSHAMQYNYAGLEKNYGLPAGLLAAMSMVESGGNPNKTSPVGAKGEFQFMPATASRFGIAGQETNTAKAAVAAAKYMQYLLNLFGGDLNKAIMAYNAGEGNIQKGKRPAETLAYLPKVQRMLAVANGGKDKNYSPNDMMSMANRANEELKKQQAEALKLQQEYGTKEVQVKAQVAEKIKKIDENTILPEPEKAEMRKKATAEGERELAEYKKGLDDKLAALSSYKASELSLINKARTDAIFNAEKEFKDNPQMLVQAKADIEAKWRYDVDQYQAKMQKQRNELYAFQKTERQVMVDGWADRIAEAELKNDEMKEMRLQALKEESERAIAIFDLEQSQKLLELNKFNMTDLQYFEQSLKIKQDLVDKSNLSPEMKNAQKAQNEREAWGNRADTLKTINDNYMGSYFGLYGKKDEYDKYKGVEDTHTSRIDYATKARDEGIIQQKEYYDILKDLDIQYMADKQAILTSGYEKTFGGMAGIMKSFGMENNKVYKTLLFGQKVWALNTALLNAKVAISQAWATPGNLVTKALAVGQTILKNSEIIGAISSFAGKGFSTGGYTGSMATNAIAGVVHGQEYVVNASNTAKYRDKLEAMNRGTYKESGNIQVNNYTGAKVETRQENGLTVFDIKNLVDEHMKSQMGNPNSTISKSIYRNTDARPSR